MAHTVTEEYGNERERLTTFMAALDGAEPGERVAVGITILDVPHVVIGEKTKLDCALFSVQDADGRALYANEMRTEDLHQMVASALSAATERFIRLRVERALGLNAPDLPESTSNLDLPIR